MRNSKLRRFSALWFGCLVSVLHLPGAEIASFQAGDSGWHLGTLAVGNLDNSPDLEIIVPHRDSTGNWFLDAFKFTGQRMPGFPYAAGPEEINTSPTLYDLDRDGRDEILFSRGNHIVALRGNGTVLWSNTVSAATYVPDGGYQTVTGGFYWYPSGPWLAHLPSSAVFSSQVSPPMVADLSGNGSPEVITAWKIQPDPTGAGQDYNPFIFPTYGVGQWGTMGETWSGGVVTCDAATGRQNFVYHLHHLVESGLAVGRMKRSGPLHIAELNDSDSVVCFDKTQPFGLWGKGMLHGQFGKNQRLMTGSYMYPIDIYTADLDGDGLDEVLVAGTQASPLWQPNETILDNDGAIAWRRWLPHVDVPNIHGWLNSSCLIPCNPDHDNHVDVLGFNHSYEITFRFWNGAELVNRPGWPKNFYPALPTPPVVGDVDGDGQEEIVIGTYNPGQNPSSGDLFVFALDGTLRQKVAVPGGLKHIPCLADVEGTGRLDVVYRALNGRVSVLNFGSRSTNLVSWATHRGNMRRDGNRGISLYPPGTPLVTSRASGYNRAMFSWTNTLPAELFRIYRTRNPEGPFQHIATFTTNTISHTDYGLESGVLYYYEIAAVRGTNQTRSAPFTVLPLLNSNLVANSGFELNDNCRWDKWFTGDIEMTNMSSVAAGAYKGNRAMRVVLRNQSSGSSIAQFNQYGIPDSTLYTTPGAFYSFGCWFKSEGISVPSEHWLEWSSSRTGYDTNSRPALPDPLYYTPHFSGGTGTSGWVYVNRTFQLPPGFPNLEIRHRYSVPSPASGAICLDNVFLRRIPDPSATNWANLISFHTAWRYQTNAPASGWTATRYDDSSWLLGAAKFGNGSGPTNISTRLPQCLPYYYFRKTFVVSASEIEELLLAMTCTDVSSSAILPPRVFLNGTEVPTCMDATLQGNITRYTDLTPFAHLLRPGTNTVAVQLANTWSDYDDIAFDMSLQAVPYHPVLPRLSLNCTNTASPSMTVETPQGSVWNLLSADGLSGDCWQLVQSFTNSAGGVQMLRDEGQGSRSKPGTVVARMYRVTPF